jgi:hypothetical protein
MTARSHSSRDSAADGEADARSRLNELLSAQRARASDLQDQRERLVHDVLQRQTAVHRAKAGIARVGAFGVTNEDGVVAVGRRRMWMWMWMIGEAACEGMIADSVKYHSGRAHVLL